MNHKDGEMIVNSVYPIKFAYGFIALCFSMFILWVLTEYI